MSQLSRIQEAIAHDFEIPKELLPSAARKAQEMLRRFDRLEAPLYPQDLRKLMRDGVIEEAVNLTVERRIRKEHEPRPNKTRQGTI